MVFSLHCTTELIFVFFLSSILCLVHGLSWCIIDTDSVLRTIVDFSVSRAYETSSLRLCDSFGCKVCLCEHKFTYLLTILFFNHCISEFVLWRFCALYFVLCWYSVTIISYHGRPARWITPFWQPAYRFAHLYFSWQINSAAAAPTT